MGTVACPRHHRSRAEGSLMGQVVGIAVFALGILIAVCVHEAGHMGTAKAFGMKVTRYFVGFGPTLWSFRRGETEYGVKALPLGGFVRIIGMSNLEDVDPRDEPRAYRQGRYRDRMKVALAGVTVNLLIAFLLFFVVIVGRGVAEGPSTTVSLVVAHSAAAHAGLHDGDRIVAVDGHRLQGWDQLKRAIQRSPGNDIVLTVERDGRLV